MILYSEEVLEKAWRYDCKQRSKQDRQWLTQSNYRKLFEIYMDNYLAGYPLNMDIYIPDWLLEFIETELDDDLS